ncbi:MAG: repeat protein [Bryobacterales bacterium]|nr:repeat protein [Bryobacterales bacterium]
MEGIGNPYRGLLAFEERDAPLFFGRDKEIRDVAGRLEHHRLLAVTGVSGSGKSSLAMAGVIPMLRAGLVPQLGNRLRVAIMKPRGGPLFELEQRLSEALERNVNAADLTRTTYGLVDSVKPLAADESLLVVVDQFEEIFAYRKAHLAIDGGAGADRFVALLLRATEQSDVPIYVMLTMRSDFLGECAVFRGLPEALNEGHYLVPKMTRHQLQEAIEGPLTAIGAEIHPALVQQLLNECEEEPDYLPVLQHLLRRMFEERTSVANPGHAEAREEDPIQ